MLGVLGQFDETLSRTKGEGMTPEMRTQIRNIAAAATQLTLKGYEDYLTGSEATYKALGLNPDLIYSGYRIDTSGLNFNDVGTEFFFNKEVKGTLVD
jgi:hypothetical protein